MDRFPVTDNPFSTRRVRPGAIPFLFPSGQNADILVDRLRNTAWWGEIVGPHGSGKSTLLASLLPVIEKSGRKVLAIALHDGQRRVPPNLRRDLQLERPGLLVVDGYEQLSYLSRLRLKWFCRRHAIGLLVTSHVSVGLPELFRTAVTAEVAANVVATLFAGHPPTPLLEKVPEIVARHGGDLRETLMELYDFYENLRSTSEQNVT